MKKTLLILFCLFSLICLQVFSSEINVVEVRRNIPLSEDETVYKDFYLNGGESSGLKKNQVIQIKRKIYIKDNSAKSIGEFETKVAELKIIHVDSKISIAREFKLIARDNEPMIEQIGVMIGDRADLTGAYIDNSKPQPRKKISEVTEPVVAPARLPAENSSPNQPVKPTSPIPTPEI